MSCCKALEIMGDLYGPEFIIQRRYGAVYEQYPFGTRVATVPLAALLGFIKPVVIPLLAALGLVLFPILAVTRMFHGDITGARGYLISTGLCLLTLMGSLGFVAVIAYSLPLVWSSAVMITIFAISVILHVRQAVKSPIVPLLP